MTTAALVLYAHLLGATVWTGGHLVLALAVLPRALLRRDARLVHEFESSYERIGLPALLLQVGTGLWLASGVVPVERWLAFESPTERLVAAKLGLLAATVLLAVHARLRLVPKLQEGKLAALAAHILAITALAVLFVLVGLGFRLGGLF